ncbi:ATP phosphoribosyltransferase [Desulfoluna butyratoxydans]|uniref:ATP phosphoribosyltransferase n=1 Tax=Desulfoluna butyratoxydans TaxID=231438 RepID=A0A4U8YR85_9BACT|nr:ATP phosphoribosyltransferase [Desulfoluna butyratoxydans]VFQ46234.1 atp phosphoribosyltransferase [Desulfoluna butyratoxydans]
MLKIALPNKGSLSEESRALISEAGYNCRRYSRELKVTDVEHQVEFIFLRPRDIAVYVQSGIIDLGVTGRDLAMDSESEVDELLPLGFGRSKFCYAVPEESLLTPEGFNGKRIATSYPGIVGQDLKRRNIDAAIIKLDGAIEISINLGVADAIADVVQTGRTMAEAGLRISGEAIMSSEAVLVTRKGREESLTSQEMMFIERLKGIVVARQYVMVEYDVAGEALESACAVTPGIEAPTVAPLRREGWFAVKAMAPKKDLNTIMDHLVEVGAKGVIATDIRTCRL